MGSQTVGHNWATEHIQKNKAFFQATWKMRMGTKSNRPSFKIRRGSYLGKLAKKSSLHTTKTLDWASRLQMRPSRHLHWQKSALLLVVSPLKGRSSLTWWQLSSAKTTFTATTLRSAVRTCPRTFPPASRMSRSATLSKWVSAKQDCVFQHAQGHQGCRNHEVVPDVLRLVPSPLPPTK